MRLRLGNPRTAVIFAPHPDDEVIGAAALIQSLRRRGTRVHVVVVADGAASHPASRRWPRLRLVAQRSRESRRALARLGVTAGAVRFLALPDGGLTGRCDRAVGRAIARHRQIDLVVGPIIDDEHPDHRAVAAAIARCRTPARRLGYRVWPHRRGGQKLAASVRMAGGWLAKRSVIGLYRTQLGAISDDPGGFAIASHELAAFAHPLETFEELRR